MTFMRYVATIATAALIGMPAMADTIYVRSGGNDANDGSTELLAKATIQAGINAADAGDVVDIGPGTFTEDVTINDAITVRGTSAASTIIVGPIGVGVSAHTVNITAAGAELRDVTVTRAGNNTTDWVTNPKNQGVIVQANGCTVRYCVITGNRNGIYVNNRQNTTITSNVITFNRTGIQVANNVSGTTITNNEITDNWTLGLLFNFDGPTNITSSVTVEQNSIAGNWYGAIENRLANTTAVMNVSKNWLGTTAPTFVNTNSTEPGYDALVPVAYGGTAENPGTYEGVIGGVSVDKTDVTPWLASASDADGDTQGWQGNLSTIVIGTGGGQGGSSSRLQEAVSVVTAGGTILATPGTYNEVNTTISKGLTLRGPNTGISGASGSRVGEAIFDYSAVAINGSHVAITASTTVTLDGLRFVDDFVVTGAGSRPMISITNHAGAHVVTNSVISRAAASAPYAGSDASPRGVELSVVPTGQSVTVSNNAFEGNAGNVFSNANFRSGIYLHGGAGTVSITGNTFVACRTAINADDITPTVSIDGNTFTGNGSSLSFGGSTPTTGSHTLGANSFDGTGTIFNLSNVASSFRLDVRASTIAGTSVTAMTDDQIFATTLGTVDGLNSGKNGRIVYRPNVIFVAADANKLLNRAPAMAVNGDTVYLQNGTYPLPGTLAVALPITILGQSQDAIITTDQSTNAISVTAAGVVLKRFSVNKTNSVNQSLVLVNGNDFLADSLHMFGQYVLGGSETTRAFEVAVGRTNVTIRNSRIHHLRQPAYLNPNVTGSILDNTVYETRGWVVDRANMTFTNNDRDTGRNAVDIAILSGTNGSWYTDLVALSNGNNNALISEQRVSPALEGSATQYVSAARGAATSSGQAWPTGGGGPRASVAAAAGYVLPGGTIYVARGRYTETVVIDRDGISLLGCDSLPPDRFIADSNECTIEAPSGSNAIEIRGENALVCGLSIISEGGEGLSAIVADSSADGVYIRENLIHGFMGPAILLTSGVNYPAIIGNRISGSYAGVYAEADVNPTVVYNAIGEMADGPMDQGAGIVLLGNNEANIGHNLFTGNGKGVYVWTGLGDPLPGTTVSDNSFEACTLAIENTSSATIEATCNWHGTNLLAAIAPLYVGPVTYAPYMRNVTMNTDDVGFAAGDGTCDGQGPITRSDLLGASFTTIGAALAASPTAPSAPVTITIDGGTYTENPQVDDADFIFDAINGAALDTTSHFILNTTGLTSSNFIGWPSSSFATLEVTPNGALAEGTSLVEAGGTIQLQAGTYALTATVPVTSGLSIVGISTGSACDDTPSTVIEGAADVILVTASGGVQKTFTNLDLRISGTAGRFFAVSGSGNAITENVTWTRNGSRVYGANANGLQADRDVPKFIDDGTDGGAYGPGTVVFGDRSLLPVSQTVFAVKGDDGNASSIATLYDYSPNSYNLTQAILTRRPTRTAVVAMNNQYTLNAASGVKLLTRAVNADIHGGASRTWFVALRSASASTAERVVYKHGDDQNGLSVWFNGGNLGVTFIENGVGHDATLLPTAMNRNYIVQIYFDGSSAAHRVGIAADDNLGNHAEVYFTDADVSGTTLTTPTVATASTVAIGARQGATIIDGAAYTSTGPDMGCLCYVSDVVVLETAASDVRDDAYCALNQKILTGDNTNGLERMVDEPIAGESYDAQLTDVYPNPASDRIDLDLVAPLNDDITVNVVSTLGTTVATMYRGSVVAGAPVPLSVDVSGLANGMYLVVAQGAGFHFVRPFVVRR